MLSANETPQPLCQQKTSTRKSKSEHERDDNNLFWEVAEAYAGLEYCQPLVSSNPNPNGRRKKRTTIVADFVIDVESAAESALQGTDLLAQWHMLAKDNLRPAPGVMRQIIRLCAPVYRERDLRPSRYFKPSGRMVKQPRSVHRTQAKTSVRVYGSHHRHGVLEKHTRAYCKEHGVQPVRDYFKNPDGNILRLQCGCDRREDAKAEISLTGNAGTVAVLPTPLISDSGAITPDLVSAAS